MDKMSNGWTLRDDLAEVLAREVSSWAARSARLLTPSNATCIGFTFGDRPTDDRSEWRLGSSFFAASGQGEEMGDGSAVPTVSVQTQPGMVCFDRRVVPTAGHVLSLVMVALSSSELGCRGARWRLAARVVETAHPIITARASAGDPDSIRLLPVFKWVRWRLLSEPFRQQAISDQTPALGGDARPCGLDRPAGTNSNPRSPLAYARGAFHGCRSLRRRARNSRTEWADTLLEYQDHPVLSRIKVEREGHLLVFVREGRAPLLDFGDTDASAPRSRQVDENFVTWFTREFFSRRFMVRDMWRAVRQPLKRWVAALLIAAGAFGVLVAVWPIPSLSLSDLANRQWSAQEPPLLVMTIGALFLLLAMLALIRGLMRSNGGERFAYPFLLRFAAGTVIGAAAVVAMRGVWISRFADPGSHPPSDCPVVDPSEWWMGWFLIVVLVMAGFTYLVIEARIHGTSGRAAFARAGGVWLIGLGWASIIAAVNLVVIGPTFTECFPQTLSGSARMLTFVVTALASLDLGIFLQVLWEDRPVTYPLGALRFSRRQ